ncbi:MAG: hypothetical protein GY853_02155 [PVC group bacterium]|nr:hypothetical protein [PVC group bacterium]
MNKLYKGLWILMSLVIITMFASIVTAVTWENEQARLTCSPDTSWSPTNDYKQYCELENKQNIERTIDLAFLFEQGLDSGSLYLGSLRTLEDTVNNVISYPITTNDCDIGVDGTRRLITIQNSSGTFQNVYCYQSVEQINNETFIFTYHDGRYEYINDISNDFNYLYRENLNNPYAYYYEDATFNPLQTRYFRIEYSLDGGGKWDFWAGNIQTQNTYYLLDPWAVNSFFSDNFDRTNSPTVDNGWTEDEGGTATVSINGNELYINDDDSGNAVKVYQDNTLSGLTEFFNFSFFLEANNLGANDLIDILLIEGAFADLHLCTFIRIDNTDIYTYDSVGLVDSGSDITAGNLEEFVLEINQTSETYNLYFGGNKIVTGEGYREPAECNSGISTIYVATSSSTHATYQIDDVTMYNQTWSPPTSSTPYIITAKNINTTTLNVFNATIDGNLKETTNGTLHTALKWNSSQLHNITIRATNHFDVVLSNQNVSSNYEASMFQSDITFACQEFITGSSLTCDNTTRIKPNAGVYEWNMGVSENYYDRTQNFTINALDNKTVTFANYTNSQINITAREINNNITIANFTINFTDVDTGFSNIDTIIGYNYTKSLVVGRNYSFIFSKNGYSPQNISISNFSSQNYQFSTYLSSSVDVFIYKESDSTLILQNITITFTDENNTVTSQETDTGGFLFGSLTPSNYTVDLTSTNFSTRTYTIEVVNNSYQILNAFLIETGDTQTVFTFQDKDTGATIEGISLIIQKVINGSYQVVESLSSDITGRVGFNYVKDEPYRFIAAKSDYIGKNFTLNPILFSSYTIYMEKDYDDVNDIDFSGVVIYFIPHKYYDGQNHTIQFVFGNPSGTFEYYGFNATYNAITIEANGSTSIGSTLSETMEILNAEFQDLITIKFHYKNTDGTLKQYTKTFLIIDSNTSGSFLESMGNHRGLGILERILIATFIVLLVAGGAAYYAGGVTAGSIAALLFGLLAYTGFIPWWTVLVSLISIFIVITWRSSQ